jgi:hypothetical protein
MEPNKIAELFAELQTNIRSDISILSKRLETIERSISSPKELSPSSFPVSSILRSESGGQAASSSPSDQDHRVESSELHNLLDNFSPKDFSNSSSSFRRDSGKRTETSQFILKDPAIKFPPPKVECKDPSKIKPKEFLEYFESVSASILSWEQVNSTRIHESEEHESDFSEFANFQQQYENENLSQQELEDLWEQFNSHCNHESDDNFSSSEHQEEQDIELEIHSNADENESLDPGGCQSPFSEASEISADY